MVMNRDRDRWRDETLETETEIETVIDRQHFECIDRERERVPQEGGGVANVRGLKEPLPTRGPHVYCGRSRTLTLEVLQPLVDLLWNFMI
jgi:hypothetical protein